MSWLQRLYETYDRCAGKETFGARNVLEPLFHTVQKAHIEVILDGCGNFRRANLVDKEDADTLIPATEKSATARTSGVAPHPLCDHIKYCAGDFTEEGREKNRYFNDYVLNLRDWCSSEHSHQKARTVLSYIEKCRLVKDLVEQKILPVKSDGALLNKLEKGDVKPELFKLLTPEKGLYKVQNALVRWVIESSDEVVTATWKDASLHESWIRYCDSGVANQGFCHITGEQRVVADKHPKGIRGGKDGAKLISFKKGDESDFIYLGRFLNAYQAVTIGREVSQKAHRALKWLIKRQAYHDVTTGQVFIAWSVSGKEIPSPSKSTFELFGDLEINENLQIADTNQRFAIRLRNAIAGYRAKLDDLDDVFLIGLGSATLGRMAITFYRELKGSEFLDRIENWHAKCAWPQNFGKNLRFVGAPSPRDIAEAVYGRWDDKKATIKVDENLLKATMERLLPCIVDSQKIPNDLVSSAYRRAINRLGFKKSESGYEDQWEKCLGIACSLFKGYYSEEGYNMTLEQDRDTRDYLYGRLLAIADGIESYALFLAKEEKNRDTTATRFMQRFADRPLSTWRTIELALGPYASRLRAGGEKPSAFLAKRRRLLDEVSTRLNNLEDRTSDAPLSGEFLLGYHCQRQAFRPSDVADMNNEPNEQYQGKLS